MSGIDHGEGGRARVALVTADGRFDRDLVLRGDVAPDSKEFSAQAKEMQIAPQDAFQFAVGITDFVSDGPNLLLVRRNQSLPVFVITPGGLVRPVRMRLPDGFTLSAVIPNGSRWVVRVSKSLGGDRGLQVATFLADPTKGTLLEKFLYSTSVPAGLACMRDNEFTFLKRDPEGGLQLLKGYPDPSAQAGPAPMAR